MDQEMEQEVIDTLDRVASGLHAIAESIQEHKDAVEGRKDELGHLPLSHAVQHVADALQALGMGDAATRMGALEGLAKKIGEGLTRMAEAIEYLKPEEN